MSKRKDFVDPRQFGKPLEASILESLKDPEYRKHYMLYRVRSSIAAVIKSLREQRGLTQKGLAAKAGVPQSQIGRLESLEDDRIPRLEQLVKIFAALDSHASLQIASMIKSPGEKREIVLV